MKYQINYIPENAFLKVTVDGRQRKLYFRDVKTYRKISKKHVPHIPPYEATIEWGNASLA